MTYVFDAFQLDGAKIELRKGGVPIALEPQVFALLLLLVENRERMVPTEEIVEKIWNGRVVSDSAIASRIKSIRHVLGDDGKSQRFIRTIRGSGFRFVADAAVATAAAAQPHVAGNDSENAPSPDPHPAAAKPSIAILPFSLVGIAGPYATIADALPHELIAELSRLRWLFVIARGSSFRFRSGERDISQIGKALGVRYCLSGSVEIAGNAMSITVELADTRDGGVVWADRFATDVSAIFEVRAQIANSIVAALEIQIPLNEARLARLIGTENLDAWSAYHLGLQQMFRFDKDNNASAIALFERAIAQDPGFARAHAGLSFTHFQNSFLRYTSDPEKQAAQARSFAERAVALDPLDPFANLTMGRVFWLEANLDGSLAWLERATTLSPNYAQGIYARAWTDIVSERGAEGQANADLAMVLSPLDPLHYAMLATRGMSHSVRGDDAEAARWADRGARAPGAHVLIGMIACIAHALNGDDDKAAAWAANVRGRSASVTKEEFFRAFPFGDGPVRRRMVSALAKHGF